MKVYLDNSATTKLDSRVFAAMKPYLLDKYANPSSIHLEGQALYLALEKASPNERNYFYCERD